MEGGLSPGCFVREWTCYLELHGHRVKQVAGNPGVLISLNGKRHRYRWLLKCVDGDSMLLTPGQRKAVRAQARLAKRARQQCFVVVKFTHPVASAVVVPAAQALRMRRLTSEKGGIPWDR
jgi:hypothetical protein